MSSPERPQALLPRIDVGHPVSVQATLNISLNVKESLRTRGAKRARSRNGWYIASFHSKYVYISNTTRRMFAGGHEADLNKLCIIPRGLVNR